MNGSLVRFRIIEQNIPQWFVRQFPYLQGDASWRWEAPNRVIIASSVHPELVVDSDDGIIWYLWGTDRERDGDMLQCTQSVYDQLTRAGNALNVLLNDHRDEPVASSLEEEFFRRIKS